MKKLPLCFLFLTIAFSSQAQFGMPSFKEVVTTFYSTYSFANAETFLKFHRGKDGWSVSEDYYANPGNYNHTVLFWNRKTGLYQDAGYPAAFAGSNVIKENIDAYMQMIDWNYEEYQFARNKYYGYAGWAWDIINDDAIQNNFTDTILESKARAFFHYGSGFIAEQFGDLFVNNDKNRIPLKATEPVAASRVNKFIDYELKAIENYKKLITVNPLYETRVGNIRIKLANEYMFMYLQLMMVGDSTRANQYARLAVYPDSILRLATAYLSDLPAKSILITGGDNDTYPTWYL